MSDIDSASVPERAFSRGNLWALLLGLTISTVAGGFLLSQYRESRERFFEASAIGSLREISAAQAQYLDQGNGASYGQLADLAYVGLIDRELGKGRKDGYIFELVVDKDNPQYLYAVRARPDGPSLTGLRWFYTDQSGVIRFTAGPPDGSQR